MTCQIEWKKNYNRGSGILNSYNVYGLSREFNYRIFSWIQLSRVSPRIIDGISLHQNTSIHVVRTFWKIHECYFLKAIHHFSNLFIISEILEKKTYWCLFYCKLHCKKSIAKTLFSSIIIESFLVRLKTKKSGEERQNDCIVPRAND